MADVDVSVTHQIKIGREAAWIKVGVNIEVEAKETVEDAIQRAANIIDTKIYDVIEQVVESVQEYEGDK